MTDSRGCTSTSDTIRQHQTASDSIRQHQTSAEKPFERNGNEARSISSVHLEWDRKIVLKKSYGNPKFLSFWWFQFGILSQRLNNDSATTREAFHGNPVLGIQTTPRVTPCGAAGIIGISFGMAFHCDPLGSFVVPLLCTEWQWNGNGMAIEHFCSVSSYLQKCQFYELNQRKQKWQLTGARVEKKDEILMQTQCLRESNTAQMNDTILSIWQFQSKNMTCTYLHQFGWSFHRMSPAGGR